MPHSFVKIELHVVFHVKDNMARMRTDDLQQIHSYIGGIVKTLGGVAIAVGGVEDHVHILCTLPKSTATSDYIKEIKRVSCKWIKELHPHYANFAWQAGYGAFSISPSIKEKVINYIRNQHEHHRRHTFHEEIEAFLKAYGMEYDNHFAVKEVGNKP